jgi:hypothetical protein
MANIHPKFYKWISFDNIMLLILIFSAIINITLIATIQQPQFDFPDNTLWGFAGVK